MRWLAILAIAIAGAIGYLAWTLSTGATAPAKHERVVKEDKPEPEVVAPTAPPSSSDAAPVAVAPVKPPPKVEEPVKVAAKSGDQAAPSIDVAARTPSDAKEGEEPEWTEQERWQNLWAANGRLEKGNYPGAVEKAMEIARRYPAWQEDAWAVAIKAHCGMNEPDKASALFQKMTDAPAIEAITKFCGDQEVKLTKK